MLTDKTVRCWGRDDFAILAGSSTMRSIEGLGNVELAATDNVTCARVTDGTARCWGLGATETILRHSHTAPVRIGLR